VSETVLQGWSLELGTPGGTADLTMIPLGHGVSTTLTMSTKPYIYPQDSGSHESFVVHRGEGRGSEGGRWRALHDPISLLIVVFEPACEEGDSGDGFEGGE